jgi:heme-degrading monooxygenase HmoA
LLLTAEAGMIARHWCRWTKPANADAYERLLRDSVLPGLKRFEGYRGGYVLRSDGPDEAEFVVVNLFESLEVVRQFAGPEAFTAYVGNYTCRDRNLLDSEFRKHGPSVLGEARKGSPDSARGVLVGGIIYGASNELVWER